MKSFNIKSLIVLLGLFVLIVGCDKDDPNVKLCYISEYKESSVTFSFTYANNQIAQYAGSTYSYDSKGNLIKWDEGSGDFTNYTYTNNLLTKSEAYDNNVLSERVEYEYNASGQLVKKTHYSIISGNAHKGNYFAYTYPNTTTQNPSKMISYNAAGVEGTTYSYEYDDKKTPYHGQGIGKLFSSAENNITKQSYLDASNLKTNVFTYEYNDMGYPLKETKKGSSGQVIYIREYAYNCK